MRPNRKNVINNITNYKKTRLLLFIKDPMRQVHGSKNPVNVVLNNHDQMLVQLGAVYEEVLAAVRLMVVGRVGWEFEGMVVYGGEGIIEIIGEKKGVLFKRRIIRSCLD